MEEQTEVTGGSGAAGKMEESKANWEPERQRNMPLLFFVAENSFCFEEVAAYFLPLAASISITPLTTKCVDI